MRTATAIPGFLLLFSHFTLPALAQPDEAMFQRLTTRDGLAGNTVVGIAQDAQGYMWFATWDGLSKYDGYDFTTYRHDSLDVNSLAQNRLETLYVDSQGMLWMGTATTGLDRFDPISKTFTHFVYDPEDSTSLSHNNVTVILEDHEGTLWVGTTQAGLNRFDRDTETFTHFRHDPEDSASLSDDNVRVLYEDSQGTLWVGTGFWNISRGKGGLNRFDRATDNFTHYKHNPDDERTLINNQIAAIYEDSQGTFWVGTWGDGLHAMNRETGAFTRYTYDPANPNRLHGPRLDSGQAAGSGGDVTTFQNFCVCFLREDRSGALWIGGFGGVNRYDRTKGTLTHYEHGEFSWANTDWRIYESREGALWIATWNGLYKISPRANPFGQYQHQTDDPHSLSDNFVLSVNEDASGELWIGTLGSGLNKYERETGDFTHYRREKDNPNSLSSDSISVIYGAPTMPGVLWIGTAGGGLDRLETGTGSFTNYRHDTENPKSLSENIIQVIYEAPSEPGVLWVGTWSGGLNRFDPAEGSFLSYTSLPGDQYRSELLRELRKFTRENRSIAALLQMGNNEDRSLSFDIAEKTPVTIVALGEFDGSAVFDYGWIEDETGEIIWIMNVEDTRADGGGTNNRIRIAEIDLLPGSYRLRYSSDGACSFDDNWCGHLPPDEPELWGIQLYSRHGRTSLLTAEDQAKIQISGRISNNFVFSILEDSAGRLWVGTSHGLNILNRETGVATSFLPDRWIYSLHEDHQGRFWLGTDDGLLLLDRSRVEKSLEVGQLIVRVELKNSVVSAILEDEDGMLWIGGSNGLIRYDPDMQTFTAFDDLETAGYYISGFASNQRGELFFGGRGGVLHFDPANVINTTPPSIALTGLRISNQPVAPGPDSPLEIIDGKMQSITLAHTQQDITFDYVGLHYGDPYRNEYMYRLEGYDTDWVQARTQRSARYPRLPPGSYTFKVKAANSDGVWSEEEAAIGVVVLPPWWRTVWAFTVYGLLFAVGVFAVDRFQRKRLIARERLRAEREKARAIESMNSELQRALKHLTETQDQLIHTEKMASLGQLTAGIAHEIKNPLNFVNNFAEISANITEEIHSILEKEKTNLSAESAHELKAFLDDLKLNAQKINEHGRRADGIVRAMLEHSRTGPGERRPVDVNALLDEYVNLAYHSWQAAHRNDTIHPVDHGETIHYVDRTDTIHRVVPRVCRNYDERVREVEIVPQELGRVFVNLLDNAFYAVNEKRLSLNGAYAPEVSVSTKKMEDGIEITVSDNGLGIPHSVRDRVFEPFFTTKPAGSGTGLGLSLSYDIVVKGHGGSLSVESEEGEGAVFVITLPEQKSK